MVQALKYFPDDYEQAVSLERNEIRYKINLLQAIRTIYYVDNFSVKNIPTNFKKFKEIFFSLNSQTERDQSIDQNVTAQLFLDFVQALQNHSIDIETQQIIGILTFTNPYNSKTLTYDALFLINLKTNCIVIYESSTLEYLVGMKLTDDQLKRVQTRRSIVLEALVLN